MFYNLKERLFSLREKKRLLLIIGIAVVILILGVSIFGRTDKTGGGVSVSSDNSAKVKATVNIGKTFEFKAVSAAKETKPVKFTLISAERKDEIKVKDEPRSAPAGKDYLLIRIEIENGLTERLAILTSDRIRLVGNNGKSFASDYNNGTVVIDPLSVRRDIVAFVVDEKTKKFTFSVGELDGEKQKIEINF